MPSVARIGKRGCRGERYLALESKNSEKDFRDFVAWWLLAAPGVPWAG